VPANQRRRQRKQFAIVVDLTQADTETLEVYYDSDRIHLSATISDKYV